MAVLNRRALLGAAPATPPPTPAIADMLSTDSATNFGAWYREYRRITRIECGVNDTTPEGATRAAALTAEGGKSYFKIVNAPCDDLGAAIAKMKQVMAGADPKQGPTDHELKMARQVYDYLQRLAAVADAPVESCPVTAALPELEGHIIAELAAHEMRDDEGRAQASYARAELVARVARLQARSMRGAAMQVAFALEMSELIRGCATQEGRDHFHGELEKHLESVLRLIGGSLSDDFWAFYVGSCHDGNGRGSDCPPARRV